MIPGYTTLATIHSGVDNLVQQARREADGRLVVLKRPRATTPSMELIARFRHEYELLASLELAGVVRALALERDGRFPVLVLEDVGGVSLRTLLERERLNLEQRLVIAVAAATALAELHGARVIHKAIRPNHLVYRPDSGSVRLIDLSQASRLSAEQSPGGVGGDLRYVAPEQTGRMQRPVDQRSDLYSLGVTLYELFSGGLPFAGHDPLELIHQHIAHQPPPLAARQPRLPAGLTAVVMKLLAKVPEERYQSARGLQRDLEHCLAQLRAGQDAPFTPGRHDAPSRIQIPGTLFGRERELGLLIDSFQRVGHQHKELVLISGYSGVGKSALVHGLQEAVSRRQGWFVMGKCEAQERNRPYSVLAAALSELGRHLLTEPEARLAEWREAILGAVGSNGRIITDLAPQIELIIGPQPATTTSSPEAVRNIFRHLLPSFIRIFCRADHPLLICLDDLQWVDSASLAVLELLMRDDRLGHLLVVGSYRENAVEAGHPLLESAARLREAGIAPKTLQLQPLGPEAITALVAATLHGSEARVRPLAQLLYRKTGGNPFFAGQLLQDLHDQGLLAFDHDGGGWHWDLERIEAAAISANVAELMGSRIQRLSAPARQLLAEAACIGGQFDPHTLRLIGKLGRRELAAALTELLDAGLVVAQGDVDGWLREPTARQRLTPTLRFVHDRIHQAAYDLLGEAEKPAHHLAIGRLLLGRLNEQELEERVFEVVGQLNAGRRLLREEAERDRLAELNLLAGQRAKRASAFESALTFFSLGRDLLGRDAWRRRYELTLTLSIQSAEASYLCGEFARLDTVVAEVLRNARSLYEEVRIHEVRIQACMFRNELKQALDIGLEVLALLGVRFPRRPTAAHIVVALLRTRLAFAGKRYEDLLDLPLMTDPHAEAVLRVLSRLGSAAYIVRPNLHPLLIFKVLGFARKHGNSPEYTFAYATYSLLLSALSGDVERGYTFGQLALDLLDRTGARHHEARTVVLVNLFTTHWKRHVRASFAPLKQAYRSGLASGDFEYGSYAAAGYLMHALIAGVPLAELEREAERYLTATAELNRGTGRNVMRITAQAIQTLLGRGRRPGRLSGDYYDESAMLRQHQSDNDKTMLALHHILQLVLGYLAGRHAEARSHAELARGYLGGIRSMLVVAVFHYYESLNLLAIHPTAARLERRRLLARVRANQGRLKAWARHAPMNFQHRYQLVQAELLRIRGATAAAMNAYDEAIRLAAEHEYLQDEALASELASQFHGGQGRGRIAALYRETALECYRRWGCRPKLAQLQAQAAPEGAPVARADAPVADPGAAHADLSALKKALKGIAAEAVHSRMIEHIIRAAVEFTGAQSGHLLLRRPGGELVIEAQWNIDDQQPVILQAQRPEKSGRLSLAVLNYVRRTREGVVIHDAGQKQQQIPQLQHDPYITGRQVRSVLCLPILTGTGADSELTGMLYLENNRATGAFTEDAFETLEIIGLSAAGRLELSRKAASDGLTGLYNHDYFRTILGKEFQLARRKQRALTAMLIDIDHFKRFNDTWGHQAGDLVLRRVARTIQQCCRDNDTVARYGGEELALILPETDASTAAVVAERIRARIAELAVDYGGQQLSVTVSIGIAALDEYIQDADTLLKRADEALYRSKREGRNRVSAA